jgi:hypothetical protein
LVSALRTAIIESDRLASLEHVTAILAHVPQGILFPLPMSVDHRQVLGALASARSNVLPVRRAWIGDSLHHPRLSDSDLKVLLTVLEPHVDGDNADQAATAALSFLVHAEREVSELAQHQDYAHIKVLRGRDVRLGGVTALSLDALFERSRAGLLFAVSPDANMVLPLVVDALPDASPIIIEGKTADFLKEAGGAALTLCSAGKHAVFALINKASRFGPDDARSKLLERLGPSVEDDRIALRRLCAGAQAAGYTKAEIWALEGVPKGIERIIRMIFGQSESDFLIPPRIADELTPRLRNHIGVRGLDTAGLETLLDKNFDGFRQLELTESEREAFLETRLTDSLLRRLPIHARSDGTIGDAENVFREADWPIPLSLREHVLTVKPCGSAVALDRQQRLITAWSPKSQIEVTLSRIEPHRLWSEILDALAKLSADKSELEPRIFEALRTTPWLVAEGVSIAPEDVLTLPPSVDEAARAFLLRDDQTPPFMPARKLAINLREHPGFAYLEKSVLPDRRSSFLALALMIEDAGIVGRLGPEDGYPLDDFTTLASDGADLKLPGWPLLAAALTCLRDDPDLALKILAAFSGLSAVDSDLAAGHLDSLAALAEASGRKGETARRAYLRGFDALAGWPEDTRCTIFGRARVPTAAGGWRSGHEVIEDGDGVALTHLLARECRLKLRKHDAHPVESPNRGDVSRDPIAPVPDRRTIKKIDLTRLEADSVAQQREFLRAWRGRVPSDLVIIYLGLIGRYGGLRKLASEWTADATTDVETLWADLDRRLNPVLYPPLPMEIDQRRFLIQPITGEHVRATAMSGDLFDAPLESADARLIVGNLHKHSQSIRASDGSVRSLITLPLRILDPSAYGQREARDIFRKFVETVAEDCLWLGTSNQQTALREILDKAADVDQATLEETELLLRDRLPAILGELKLPNEFRSQKALREYQQAEGRIHRLSGSAEDLDKLKTELWKAISSPDVAAELLSAVRAKIKNFGYSGSRVLFELFQNADDAYRQQATALENACFRVEVASGGSGGFRVVHWGRLINHLGPDSDEGRHLGHDRDLLNMLLMNFSEKRTEEDLTGKFGLGFKSVHVLSDSVGIASGFIALRTLGGFVPTQWPAGIDEAEAHRRTDGLKATVIDVPFSPDTAADGDEAIRAFRASMAWAPACARSIRRIEIVDDDSVSVDCADVPLLSESAIRVVTVVSGTRTQRALRFDLANRYSLLLRIGPPGPSAFPDDLRRLWNLAPLEETLRSGWLLNGPFAVDPGRGRLSGTIGDREKLFSSLGRSLGERLLRLHDLAVRDWKKLAIALDLDASEELAKPLFWSRLFDVFSLDCEDDDDLAQHLHIGSHGYGHLVAERSVVPTRLIEPLNDLVRASDVAHFIDGALSESTILEKVRDWQALTELEGRIVASGVAEQLKKLGFSGIRPIRLSDLLRREIGSQKRVDAELAKRLGSVITPISIRERPLINELTDVLAVAKEALFLTQDGSWRIAQLPYLAASNDEEERRLCAFAPARYLLDEEYSKSAFEFFRVAREQSGFGAQARDLAVWAAEASERDRQVAALRYVVEGYQGGRLADAMRQSRPAWLPWPVSELRDDALLSGWTEKEKDDLLYAFEGRRAFEEQSKNDTPASAEDAEKVLAAIHDWWIANRREYRDEYTASVYPSHPSGASFSPLQLRESDDRAAWFTMFALACFQSFGGKQDEQHRSFIEAGYQERWWLELAESRPPGDVQSWLDRLERWSSPAQLDQYFLPWRRSLVDLYTVARWLEEYREIILKLPRIIGEYGVISLNGALQPSYWPAAMRLCIDAAPINRSLGIGVNWMIRELVRHGVYERRDESLMAPYCWVTSHRVRETLNALGANVGARADKDASRTIYDFVVEHIGTTRARFTGDFDLPLQLITRAKSRSALEQCFRTADRDPPSFIETNDDT